MKNNNALEKNTKIEKIIKDIVASHIYKKRYLEIDEKIINTGKQVKESDFDSLLRGKLVVKDYNSNYHEYNPAGDNILHLVSNSLIKQITEKSRNYNEDAKKVVEAIKYLVGEKGMDINAKNENGYTPLSYATMIRIVDNYDIIETMLNLKADVNVADTSGLSPLLKAAYLSRKPEKTLELLIENKADVKAKSTRDNTVLSLLLENKNGYENLDLAKYLVEKDCPISWTIINSIVTNSSEKSDMLEYFLDKYNANRNDLNLSLIIACKNKSEIDMIKLLVEKKASVNVINDKDQSPLHFLFCNKNINESQIKFLLENKANANKKDKYEMMPLNYGVKNNMSLDKNIVKLLCEHGVDFNHVPTGEMPDKAPIVQALNKSELQPETIALLIENKASLKFNYSLSLKKTEQTTVLDLVTSKHKLSVDLIKLLTQNGLNLDSINNITKTPHSFNIFTKNPESEVVKYLLENRLDPNYTDPKDRNGTLLHKASEASKVDVKLEILKLLIEFKADANAVNDSKSTPLHLACAYGNDSEKIKLLIQNTNVNSKNLPGHQPLHLLCCGGPVSEELVKSFVEKKAELNQEANVSLSNTREGSGTPLKLALIGKNYSLDVIKCLIKDKSDVNFSNKNDNSAFEYALAYKSNDLELLNLMVSNGAALKTDIYKHFSETLTAPTVLFEFLCNFKQTICKPFITSLKIIKINVPKPVIKMILKHDFLNFLAVKFNTDEFGDLASKNIDKVWDCLTQTTYEESQQQEIIGDNVETGLSK